MICVGLCGFSEKDFGLMNFLWAASMSVLLTLYEKHELSSYEFVAGGRCEISMSFLYAKI